MIKKNHFHIFFGDLRKNEHNYSICLTVTQTYQSKFVVLRRMSIDAHVPQLPVLAYLVDRVVRSFVAGNAAKLEMPDFQNC